MTHEQFWDEDPWLAVVYQDAFNMRKEMRNQELWLQGLYCWNAFETALTNFAQGFDTKHKRPRKKYLEKPVRITPLTRPERIEKAKVDREKVIAHFTRLQKMWEGKHASDS